MTPAFLAPHSPWPGGIYSWFSRLDAPSRKGAYFEVLERNRVFWLLQSDVTASLFQQLSAYCLASFSFCPGFHLPPVCSSRPPFLSLTHVRMHTVPHIYASIEREREQLWWGTPVVSALGRGRQEDQQFRASLDYMRL